MILVTGAAGFVGGHLLDLLTQGSTPIAAWHRPGYGPAEKRSEVTWQAVELLDRAAVQRTVAEVRPSAVYHLAGAAHVAESWQNTFETYQTNVLATHYLLVALTALEWRPRVLVAGSATIYRPQNRPLEETDPLGPSSPYAASKLAQEMRARHAFQDDGIPTLLARSFNHVGPRQDPSYVAPAVARQIALIEAGRQEPTLTMGNVEATRDLTDVRDTVRAYVAMMASARPGQTYNVCSGRGVSISALVTMFTSRARRSVTVVQDPSRFRPSDVPLLVGSYARLTTDTGWTPQIPLEQTVDDLIGYWRQRIGR
jgi:GDP-4-dehydro-6-deoxy-D-mannose reductase